MKDNTEQRSFASVNVEGSAIAIRHRLAEIAAVMLRIGTRMTLQTFRSDPMVRRPVAYAI
jgi:hypothetical protein